MTDNNQLTSQQHKALKKLRIRKDIVIVPADKERTTVIIDKEEYIEKAEEVLADESTQTYGHKYSRNVRQSNRKNFKRARQSRRHNRAKSMGNMAKPSSLKNKTPSKAKSNI
ncbi:unnamed protein product [Schistosoma margrebowiei]|uniref:Uncharacterized protein n=1 Tax=Schistosoma margrebowiei TaxID=48269 RepID=A0A183LZJ0_9TREM|nr:unnamed protein product [Schistosoma margrebowiei]